jgi:hypothetical protein
MAIRGKAPDRLRTGVRACRMKGAEKLVAVDTHR